MRKALYAITWAVGIIFNLAVGLEVGTGGWSNAVASLLTVFNAEPDMGTVRNTYTAVYIEAWASAKGLA